MSKQADRYEHNAADPYEPHNPVHSEPRPSPVIPEPVTIIPDELLADHYRAADVFALSSRYEPFGMTAVEAMACGTPTVVTTEGGLWEQVTWGLEALYANPFDPEAFGHALTTILAHRRVSDQLAKFGSQKARARFTWTGVAQQLLRALRGAELPARYRAALSLEDSSSAESREEEALKVTASL